MSLEKSSTFVAVVELLLVLAACSTSAPTTATPTPIPTPTATPSPTEPPPVSEGQRLFINKGCAACHGQQGEGTSIAPALGGHTAEQVRRQVRAPLGTMPVFPPDKISNRELEEIAKFIETLEGGHGHFRAGGSGEELILHHWMALFAIEAGDTGEALHHLGHISHMTEGEHLARMRDAESSLESGDIHAAAHIVEEMLAGMNLDGLGELTMHLRLALSAARVEDTDNALHHMEHYTEMTIGPQRETGEEILSLIHGGRMHDANHMMEELLGAAAGDEEDSHQEMGPHGMGEQ